MHLEAKRRWPAALAGPARSGRRQIVGQRDLRRRAPGPLFVPRLPGAAVATDVLAGAAERQQHEPLGSGVDELAADTWRHTRDTPLAEHVLDALDDQRQLAGEHQVDLFLVLMGVNARTLARRQQDQVDPERVDAQLAAQALKALPVLVVERCEGHVAVAHRTSIGQGARRTTATAGGAEQPLERKTILALVAMGVAVFIVANDFTALAVALPAIEKQFNTDVGTVQWVINAYALTFGVLIVVGGRLADIFGRKRIFILGAAIFAGFSVLGGAAQSTAWLISCRALMGIGNAVGPMFGGVLTDALSWRWIFFVNVPIAAFGVLATWLAIHQTEPEPADRRIDYGGVATLSLGLVSLLVALDQVTDWGWGDARIVALLVICAVMLVGLNYIERRMNEAALIPRDVIATATSARPAWPCC